MMGWLNAEYLKTTTIVEKELIVRPSEHEVFLSFNDDAGAYAFHRWWHKTGLHAFADWAEREDKDETSE